MPTPLLPSGASGSGSSGPPLTALETTPGGIDDTWKELLGCDNHYKLVATASWLFGCALELYFVMHGAPYLFQLSWTSLVFTVPYGLKGLTAWLNTKGGGTVEAAEKEIIASLEGREKPDDVV